MKFLYTAFYCFCLTMLASELSAQSPTENVILITLDGLRWEELYTGADSKLINHTDFVSDTASLVQNFWADSPEKRRQALLPFFWEKIAVEGQLYGNRDLGNKVDCMNRMWFSYPGYNEILTGSPDPRINSNAKKPNPNKTILEVANRTPEYEGKVAAFGSWDVFPYIINETRSGVPVNAGFEPAKGDDLTEKEKLLNELQTQIPSPWGTVRLDAFTHHYAKEYLKKHRPKLLYISYGETDDFAHDGRYDHYLHAAHRTDAFIRDLWEWVQTQPDYRGKTTLVITTDHGRGHKKDDSWKNHGVTYEGAGAIWIAVLGPNIEPLGVVDEEQQLYQGQVAATVAEMLDIPFPPKDQNATESIYSENSKGK